ncbi:MAG: imidazolonepropionase [Spirochaetaceae bacterium]|nr:imidazolonepropionase [Spirochaetaceae bacterium]
MAGDILVTNIGELSTPLGFQAPRGPEAMGRVATTKDAAVLVRRGKIEYAGPAAGLPAGAASGPGLVRLDAGGRAVVPGFVDSHTHFVFAGYRDDEFLWKAAGMPYMEIHKRGGGIARSVQATRAASKAELVALGASRLKTMLALGVTTVEGKSGYGLDLDTELRQLEAMRDLQGGQPVEIVPTFLGPHSIPVEYAGRPADYIDYVIAEVLPRVAESGLARFADVFCEKGVFSVEDSRRYLIAAKRLGLGVKLHADEIERLGGAGLAAELGAASADHLLKASLEDIGRMAEAGVVAGCLPLTAFTLREPYADARAMIDSGCALAIASDLNPGSCYSQSLPLAIAIAVLYLRLTMEESLTAVTLGGAASLGLADRLGSLEPGKQGDLLVLDAPSCRFLAYNAGMNLVRNVVKRGDLVFGPAS